MSQRRILIVEDEAVTSVMLEKTLKELGVVLLYLPRMRTVHPCALLWVTVPFAMITPTIK